MADNDSDRRKIQVSCQVIFLSKHLADSIKAFLFFMFMIKIK